MAQVKINGKQPNGVANVVKPPPIPAPSIAHQVRKRAIERGDLIDLTDVAVPLYWVWPIACTSGVYAALVSKGVDAKKEGERGATYGVRSRQLVASAWAAVNMRRQNLGGVSPASPTDSFPFLCATDAGTLRAVLTARPGDDGKPCLTISHLSES